MTRWLVALLALAALAAPAAGTPAAGAIVSAVELRLDAPLGRRVELEPLIAVRPGEALTEQAVRRTLSNLQATGLFSEIEILRRPDGPAAVIAVVVLRARTWVSAVELRGKGGLDRRTLLRAVVQKEARPLIEEHVDDSVRALEELYRERGYLQAEVRAAVETVAGKRVVLAFELAAGPRARIGELDFEGDLGPFRRAELEAALKGGTLRRYGRERVEADVRRLRAWLVRRGHLRARVERPREVYRADAHRMDLTYPVSAGPAIEVQVAGASRRQLERKGLLPFLKDEPLDEGDLARVCRRIEDHFQRRGHYKARARCALDELGGGHRLTVDVEPGEVYRLTRVTFSGNRRLDDDELLPLMTTSPWSRFSPGSGRLVRQSLDEDLDNLLSYYLLRGFADAEIGTLTITEDGRRLALDVEILEGPQQRLVDFTFSGLEQLDLDRVRAGLPLKPGGPFHPVLLDDSINIIRALYEDRGFPSVTVRQRLDWNADHTLVDVHLEVDEGPQAVVDRLVLRGLQRSKPSAVRRLVKLEEGDPISRRRLLEAERDLYRLGIFSKVDVEQRPVLESSEKRDVLVRLEEGRRVRLAYGLSYHSDDGLGALLSVTRANVGGRGDRLQLDLRGNRADNRYRLLYDQPLLWRWNVPITYSVFGESRDRDFYSVDKLGAQVAVTKDLPTLRLRGVAEYRQVDLSQRTSAFPDFDPNDVEREDREVEIFSWISIFYADRRDDPLDPATGWTSAVQLEYAVPFFDADTEFLKLFWQQTHYLPFGRFGGLAASFRLGAVEPLDRSAELDPFVPPELPSARVPISERFFAGGRTSHRAYDRDRLGIPGETLFPSGDRLIETGGNGLAVFNLDYRFPITGPVGGVVFLDHGNVFADWRDFDPSDFKPGAGLGVRYASPIGPVRLEIGWKLDPEPGEDTDPVFFLSFGNPF